ACSWCLHLPCISVPPLGRPGGCPPGLPQIRTCPTKAYGSSSHGFALRSAIRCRFVNRVLRLGVLARSPDSGSVTRPSLPSAGSARSEFPDFHGTMEDSDPCHPVSTDSCARPAIPPRVWPFAPAAPRRRGGRPGVSGSVPRRPTERTREDGRSLRLLGDPGERSPCSGTPAGP